MLANILLLILRFRLRSSSVKTVVYSLCICVDSQNCYVEVLNNIYYYSRADILDARLYWNGPVHMFHGSDCPTTYAYYRPG